MPTIKKHKHACFREEVTANPEKKVPRPPDQDIQPLG